MNDESFPGLKIRELANGITWEFYKHWAQCYGAGEGLEEIQGDHSGCIHIINGMKWTMPPRVAQARVYKSAKGWISAVYSYPNGIGLRDTYFWEIWFPGTTLLEDPERYDTEEEMEARIIEVLS